MESIIKNAIEDFYCYVDERDGGTVDVSSATYEVFDSDDVSVQASASASIEDNGTATPDIYGSVDTTASDFVACNTYYVLFSVTMSDGQVPKYKSPFKVV